MVAGMPETTSPANQPITDADLSAYEAGRRAGAAIASFLRGEPQPLAQGSRSPRRIARTWERSGSASGSTAAR
jgi:hypothetical protein